MLRVWALYPFTLLTAGIELEIKENPKSPGPLKLTRQLSHLFAYLTDSAKARKAIKEVLGIIKG